VSIRVAGHFGEWVQGRLGPDGPVALLTLPCKALWVDAERRADGPLALEQRVPLLTMGGARAFIAQIGGMAGHYCLTTNMLPGGGAGASTAALVALSRSAQGDPAKLVAACLAAEGASDPLMLPLPDRVLWASREGRVLADLPVLPAAEIVGGFWGAPVATDPSDTGFPDITDIAARLVQGIDLVELAQIASQSAQRCTALRGPSDDPTESLAQNLGALGYMRAHTGSARGLIFAPGHVPDGAEAVLQRAGFQQVLRFCTGENGK
jgi:uncharacterized protein involved in propanediol utilization